MASVDWKKYKSKQYVKAVLRHNCNDTREQTQEHTNPHIQPDKTHLNTGFHDTYADAKKRFERGYKRLTEGKTVRKDAVVGLGFSVPVPKGLPEDKTEAFLGRVHEILCNRYGAENVVSFSIHRDERHEYIDPDTKQKEESRDHAQGIILPEVDGGLCAKKVLSRKNMISLNDEIDRMSRAEFGLAFVDGSKRKSRGSVEHMKNESLKAENELLREENKTLKDEKAELEARVAELEKQVDGPLLRMVYKKAKDRKEQYEADAEAAKALREEEERMREEARKGREEEDRKAEEARQRVAEAKDARKREEALTAKQRAESGRLKAFMDEQLKRPEELRDYFERIAENRVPSTDKGIIYYMKANKREDGRTLYDYYREKATVMQKRTARKQVDGLDALIADAERRASNDKQQGSSHDYEIGG